ncbi:hypothetical protein FRC19_008677 [Serendipita sp. 401]|nr:hypothetical protein FRC19_008677 [Serendipita sp. 401]
MFFSKVKTLLLPLGLATSVLGHGQVRYFITSTTTYPAADAYAASPDPSSPIRKLDTYGPAAPFTGTAITCGSGGNNAAAVVAPVAAGSVVTFDWGSWTSSPVMTYIAACPSGCASFKGESGNVWVKIQQEGYVASRTPPWAEQLIEQGGQSGHGKWSITIPSTLPNGEYILRHEILALSGYSVREEKVNLWRCRNCVQIKITGGGSVALPSGVAFPGAYQPNDPGILIQLWYVFPIPFESEKEG